MITGDLVDGYVDDLHEQVAPLADLRARDGVFFVTGNHEYYWRAGEWVKELTRLGVVFLKNEHRLVRPRLVIAGIGRTWLYVSRGTGYWGPPSRLGVHGEITVIELSSAFSPGTGEKVPRSGG